MAKKDVFKKTVFAVLGVCLAAILFFAGYFTYYLTMSREEKYLLWAAGMIADKYTVYDETTGRYKEYTAEELIKALVAGLPLDRYSAFYSEKEYADVVATSHGNQFGVGLTFSSASDEAVIFSVIGNSPAERAGIVAGGRITALEYGGEQREINGYSAFAAALSAVPANEPFDLYITYNGEPVRYELRRESFKESYVRYADSGTGYVFRAEGANEPTGTQAEEKRIAELAENTAYIAFSSFMYPAVGQFADALEFMFARGKSALVLDLRNNGGGYMDVLTEIASYFIPSGKRVNLVASAKPKRGAEEKFYTSADRYDARLKELVILANDGTASAAECLIGALQYYGMADGGNIVITKNADGRARTFGKGIMQTTYVSNWGGALKLTTAYVYQPDGETCIHGTGIGTAAENEIAPVAGKDAELLRAIEILKG
ncbi:MAG: hypothetical protein DBX59_02680 [Bacillota bacterium]|nr:MAG: hypothetical protein DBX59_02680 [Bacillota bacterium]